MGYVFDFERLVVYQKALDISDKIFVLTKDFSPRVQSSLGDQLRRAALSICNNIAEGSGKKSAAAKGQYYSISLDSARECIPVITLALRQKELSPEQHDQLREEVIVICKMLFKLLSSVNR